MFLCEPDNFCEQNGGGEHLPEKRDGVDKLSDEQLLFLVRYLHKDPFEVLLERYHPVIGKVVQGFTIHGYEEEDLWQEARMVFHHVIQYYEDGKGLTLGSFFKVSLQHHLYSLVRKGMADKRRIAKQVFSLDKIAEKGAQYPLEYAKVKRKPLSDRMILEEELEGFSDLLSPLEKEVFSLYFKEMTEENIAEKLDYPIEKVKNALERSKRKMKDYLGI